MGDLPQHDRGVISRNALVVMILLAGGVTMAGLCSSSMSWALAQLTVIMDATLAALVVLSAAGYGHLVIRKLSPRGSPLALRAVSSCAVGLWMLSTLVLIVGSTTHGLLNRWVWWSVIIIGAALGGWFGRKQFNAWRIPQRSDGRVLVWVVIAIAVGFWFAGATIPPGYIGGADGYDVVTYHLQVPREFYDAQHIGQLQHNCYSYYPLGVEMLFLLGMCLHGSVYEGVYLAKLLHGAFGVLTVAAVYLALRKKEEGRARFAAGMIATTPFVLHLSWLGMVELSEICYLTLGLLWVRQWIEDKSPRGALCVGTMLGAACAMKYLSIGLVALPILVIMLVLSVRTPRKLPHVLLAGGMTVLLFAPWGIRNIIYTRNPVFPLGTSVFGRGYWSEQSEQRWVDGHGPQVKPPVPQPPGYQARPRPTRLELFYSNFVGSQLFGQIVMIVGGLAICLLFAEKSSPGAWNWSLVGVLGIQVGIWLTLAHQGPARFIVPAIVPICLLAARALAHLSAVQVNPFRKGASRSPHGAWGVPPAVAIFIAAVTVNLWTTYNLYRDTARAENGRPPETLAIKSILSSTGELPSLSENARFLLIGNMQLFYFPSGTIYAIPFDANPLAEIIESESSPRRMLERLRGLGVTHLWVNWAEVWRLAQTYGYPDVLSGELFERWEKRQRPGLSVLDEFEKLGAVPRDIDPDRPFAAGVYWKPRAKPVPWVAVTVYTLPWAVNPTTSSPSTPPKTTTSS